MEFIFKPEKCGPELVEQTAEVIGKRAELASRKRYPSLWGKADSLNERKMPDDVLHRRKIRRVIYGVFLIAVGIFLFVPGIIKPKELFVPLVVGAFSFINGIFAVLPRRSTAEKFEKKAKKLLEAINSSLAPGDTVVFNEEAVFENGALLMEYEDLEPVLENRSIWFLCDGVKVMVLRKTDLVSASSEEFLEFIKEKTSGNTIKL